MSRTATVAACSNHFMELWPCPHPEASSALMQKTVPNNGVDMLCMHDLHAHMCTCQENIYIYEYWYGCVCIFTYVIYIYIQIIGVTMRPIMWMPVQTYLPAGYRRTCSVKMTPWNHAVAAFHSAITKKRVYLLVRPRFLNQYPEPPAKTLHDSPHFVDQKTWRLITTSKTKLACHGASPKKLASWPSGAAQFFQPSPWFVSQFWHPANGDWETSSIFDTVSAKLKMNGTLKQSSSDTPKKTRQKNKSLFSEGWPWFSQPTPPSDPKHGASVWV